MFAEGTSIVKGKVLNKSSVDTVSVIRYCGEKYKSYSLR